MKNKAVIIPLMAVMFIACKQPVKTAKPVPVKDTVKKPPVKKIATDSTKVGPPCPPWCN